MASRSLILLLLRLRWDNCGQSLRAPRPLLILLSLSSNFFNFGNLGNPLSVVRPTLIRLSVSRFSYSSVKPSICVARALSRFSSLTWKKLHFHVKMKSVEFASVTARFWLKSSPGNAGLGLPWARAASAALLKSDVIWRLQQNSRQSWRWPTTLHVCLPCFLAWAELGKIIHASFLLFRPW